MSRKQFDRMELLTDETEVDRTFLHSKLRAIVYVPFSLTLSLSLSVVLSISLHLPFHFVHQHQSPNPTGCRLQVPTSAKILAGSVGISRLLGEFEEKRERNACRVISSADYQRSLAI